jgi:hypothetical protein
MHASRQPRKYNNFEAVFKNLSIPERECFFLAKRSKEKKRKKSKAGRERRDENY